MESTPPYRPFRAACCIIGILLASPNISHAQMPNVRLAWVFPAGAQAGTTTEITVSGADLDGPSMLRFSDSRVTATVIAGSPQKFRVAIPSEMTAAMLDVRFIGRFGLSNPRSFSIDDLPGSGLSGTNLGPTIASDLPLETVIYSRAPAGNAHWYRLPMPADQRVIVRIVSSELDSRMEPVLVLLDSGQRELDRSVRGFIDVTSRVAGTFFIEIHDRTFRGGEEFPYRLVATRSPHLDFAYPHLLTLGNTNRVTLYGRNLPGGQPAGFLSFDGRALEKVDAEIVVPKENPSSVWPLEFLRHPAAVAVASEIFTWRWFTTNGSSNPLRFFLSTQPVVVAPLAAGAASTHSGVEVVTLPVDFCGSFPKRGEISGVQFEARAGTNPWFELFADRIGLPCDPFAVLQRKSTNSAGASEWKDVQEFNDQEIKAGGSEFSTVTRDPAGRCELKEDGTYRLLIRDLLNPGRTSPRHSYRLTVRPETPDFRLVAFAQPPPKANNDDRALHVISPMLRPGQTLPVRVFALRRDGFAGPIDLSAYDLPQGVMAGPARIAAGQNSGVIMLTATENAHGTSVISLLGTTLLGTNELRHGVLPAGTTWPVPDFNNESVPSRGAREFLLAIHSNAPAPVSLVPVSPEPIQAVPGGKLSVPMRVIRRGDFSTAFNVKPTGLPELDKAKEISIPEKATNVVMELNLAETLLPPGTHTLWWQGNIAGKFRMFPEADADVLKAIEELKTAEVALTAAAAPDKPAAEERKKVIEARRKAAEEKAKPRDVTLTVFSTPLVVTVPAGNKKP